MRLDKFLADMKAGSRKDLKVLIRKKAVTVNGEVIRDAGYEVAEDAEVCVRGVMYRYRKFEYYMMNKPAGVVSATEDRYQSTVLDLIGGIRRKDLFPVGRLDKDTVGLLLLTNDGQLAHRLLSPKRHVDKVYEALVEGEVTEADAKLFAEGIRIDASFTAQPAALELLGFDKDSGRTSVRLTIREGKFHQVKRMFEAVGKEVLYLKRLAMGSLILDPSLKEGQYRELTDAELTMLYDA
jgi:16S rRNA pseudouridine516 synthase